MKGIILAGGTGSRLAPLTDAVNKHLLPVGGAPMIFHPLAQLLENGIADICVVSAPSHIGQLASVLGGGARFGADLSYKAQERPGGIAEALGLCRGFAGNGGVAVMLGDNVFGSLLDLRLPHEMAARFFVKRVPDPCRFGIAEVDGEGRLLGIEEKPRSPKSDLAVAGAYLYGAGIWAAIDSIAPSERGELEISDANEALMSMEPGTVQVVAVLGWWSDAGTRPSYHRANEEIGRVISPSLARRLNAMCGGDAPVFADEEPTILPDGEDAEWPYESQSALERAAP